MITINTLDDIRELGQEGRLPKVLVDELEQYFKDIVTNLTGKVIWDSYNLEEDGSIYILESTDNPKRMDELGFSEEDGGLFGATPEFVIIIELGKVEYYKIVIACNNTCSMVLYCAVGTFGEEFDEYIKEFVID